MLGVALVVLSACGYGSGPLFAKSVYAAGVGWLTLLTWRFTIGAVLSWAWLIPRTRDRGALRRLTRREVWTLLGLGAFFVLNSATYYAGLETVSASLAAVIVYMYPAIVAVLAVRFGHGLQGRRPWAALAVVICGVVLTIGGVQGGGDPRGLALIVASPILYSVYIILTARVAGERRGATAESRRRDTGGPIPPSVAAAVMTTGTFAVYAAGAAVTGVPTLPGDVPQAAWFGLLGIGVFSTAIAVQAFYAGAARIGAAQAALVSTVEPVYTIALATLLFGEALTPVQLLGAALVVVGVVLSQTTPGATIEAVREEA